MQVGPYTLVNEDKVTRAIHGTVGRGGVPVGGVGESATDNEKLAAYDKLAGFIKLGDDRVKRGSFYDFEKRAPRATPEVKLQFTINGKVVEVDADAPLPPMVRAAKAADAEAAAEADLGAMTLPELKDYAAEHSIDLGEAKTKAAVLAAIRDAAAE